MSSPSFERQSSLVAAQLRLAAWAGIVTGLGEAALFGIRRLLLGRLVFLPSDVVWMAPLADLVTFLLLGAVLALAGRVTRGRIGLSFTFGCLTALGTFTLSLQYGPLARIAAAVLAAGVGVQAARMARRWPGALERLVRRSLLPLAGLVFLAAVGLQGQRYLLERGNSASRTTPRAGAPNVLLIILDTVRSLDLSVYGYDRPTTPVLDRFARSGVRFDRVISPAPWTLPAHASIFTGRWPHELSASWLSPLDGHYPTLAEVLARHGWVTAGFVANTQYTSRQTGLARGFGHYRDYPVTPAQILLSSAFNRFLLHSRYRERALLRIHAADINAAFLHWLQRPRRGRPFFAFLNYMDAHDPYQPPAPFAGRFSSPGDLAQIKALEEDTPGREWSPAVIHAARAAYDESILSLDAQLGELFDTLRARGILDNTLVVVTSDHGEEFGEHGVFFHGNSLYRPSVEVPLLMRWPGWVPKGATVTEPVSTRDLAATLADLAGIRDASFPGRSLARLWGQRAQAGGQDTLLSEVDWAPRLPANTPVSRGNMRSVVLDGWRLIRDGKGGLELYDFDHDTAEVNNLAGAADQKPEVARLEAVLRATGAIRSTQ